MICTSLTTVQAWEDTHGIPTLIVPHKIRCDLAVNHDGSHAADMPHWDWVPEAMRGKRVAWMWTKTEREAQINSGYLGT